MSHPSARPVVVAVADEHDTALRYAAGEAVRDRRPLRVVHVVHPPRGGPGPETVLVTFEAAEQAAQELLDDLAQRALQLVAGQVPVQRRLCRGPAVEALLEQCADADRLVLQRRHGPRLDRILTGSTVAGLAARAPVRIVSVPERWQGAHPDPRVTVALGDRDEGSREEVLLSLAFAEAEARAASLTVLHAWYLPAEYGDAGIDRRTLEHWQDVSRQDLEQHLVPWREAHPSVDVRVDVPHLRPVDAIVRASEHSDLLLVARRRSHGVVHLGSVVRTAVRKSRCPLVVVTPDTKVRDLATPHEGVGIEP